MTKAVLCARRPLLLSRIVPTRGPLHLRLTWGLSPRVCGCRTLALSLPRAYPFVPKRGAGSIVSFGIKGGRAAGKKFIESLRMISHLANVGDAKTLVIHPASTTHQQMDADQLEAAGIGEELVRLSVGIETAGDIIDDLSQALRISQKV